MLRLERLLSRNSGPRVAMAIAGAVALALGAEAQESEFAVTAGYEAGKIAVRDAATAEALVMQRTLKLWEDNTGGQSIAPTIEFVPQPTGYDMIYTFANTTAFPKKQGQIRVGVFTQASEIKVLDGGRRDSAFRDERGDAYGVYHRYYPHNMYSPVWVIKDGRYATGVSVQYPMMDYRHDLRFAMRRSAGGIASGEGGIGWYLEIRFSNAPTDTVESGLRYEAIIPPGETRKYVVNVRTTDDPADWMRTLVPYRDFFRKTYGGVRYDRRTEPVVAHTLAVTSNASNSNPYGWNQAAQSSPDQFGWSKLIDDLASRTGWSGYMIVKPTGVFKNNKDLNFPFQFTSRWLENENMRTALDSRTGFPSLVRRTKQDLGFWWGRSTQVMTEWDNGKFEPLDPDNPEHVRLCMKEMGLAAQAGATIIGLDTFAHKWTPVWKLYPWLQRLRFIYPQMQYVIEPISCDVMHTVGAMWLRGYADGTAPENEDDIEHIRGPHLLADFLLPGHETWAAYRYFGHTTYFGTEITPERVREDMRRHADFGMVPMFFVDMSISEKIEAKESWLTTVPADLQIPRNQYKASPPPSMTITHGGGGLVDEQTMNSDQSNQMPGSGMGETPGSRLSVGPMEEGSSGGHMSTFMSDGGGRGPTINHSDVAKALQRAALTRTGGIAVAPPQLPAQMRIGKQTVPAMKQQPMIISGRVAKPTTVVVAGDD